MAKLELKTTGKIISADKLEKFIRKKIEEEEDIKAGFERCANDVPDGYAEEIGNCEGTIDTYETILNWIIKHAK